MSEERRVLGVDQRPHVWVSSLTGALYAYDDGWKVYMLVGGVGEWRPYRPGMVTETVYARSGEAFTEEPTS